MLTNEQFDNWIKALRSGEYPQTRNVLRSETGYCCLGVLADTVDSCTWLPRQIHADGSPYEFYHLEIQGLELNGTYISFLPEQVLPAKYTSELMTMNDDGLSFNVIADYLEQNRQYYVNP